MNDRQTNTETIVPTDPVAELRSELDDVAKQRDDYLAMLKEKQAEFENYQKRNAREREIERKYWNFALAHDLLPAIDNLERALAVAKGAGESGPLVQGVAGTHRSLLDILARHGVGRIEVNLGDPLDPSKHEAVMQQASAAVPAGSVVQVIQPGYKIHDRILRPAGVSVSKGLE